MKVLISGIILLLIGLFVQIITWRLLSKTHRPRGIAIIFGAVFLIWMVAVSNLPELVTQTEILKFSVWEILQLFLFYGSVSLTYFIFYTAIIDPSPTLTIVRMLLSSGENGLEVKEFAKFFRDDLLILPRLDSLVQTGMAFKQDDCYVIAPRGKNFIRWFVWLPDRIFPLARNAKVG